MEHRLLVDLDALIVLESLPQSLRKRLLDRIRKLRSNPEQCSDYQERDEIGRLMEISIVGPYGVHYWIDSADRHVKFWKLNSRMSSHQSGEPVMDKATPES